jgi:hypothetical protein
MAITMSFERCLICENDYAGSGSLASDGEWAWATTLPHYVEKHFVIPEDEFLDKILRSMQPMA